MTKSNNIGRGRKNGSRNKKIIDPSQKILNSFFMAESNNQSSSPSNETSSSDSILLAENSNSEVILTVAIINVKQRSNIFTICTHRQMYSQTRISMLPLCL